MCKPWKRSNNETHQPPNAIDRGAPPALRGPITRLRALGHGFTVALDPQRKAIVIGRSPPPAVDVQLVLPSVSRVHARLERGARALVALDLASKNGLGHRVANGYAKVDSVAVYVGERFLLGLAEMLALDEATHELTGRLSTYLEGDDQELDRALEAVAGDHMILLHGTNSGQLQELARAIHESWPRDECPFTEVSTFVGADEVIAELYARAGGGTIYLEMPEPFPLPMPLARKLLTKHSPIRTIIGTAATPQEVLSCFGAVLDEATRKRFPICALGFPRRDCD